MLCVYVYLFGAASLFGCLQLVAEAVWAASIFAIAWLKVFAARAFALDGDGIVGNGGVVVHDVHTLDGDVGDVNGIL